MSVTANMNDPYCADGVCKKCGQWYFVLTMEERKARNGICTKCQVKNDLVFRRLVVDNKPYVCSFCGRDPVFIEREPGHAIFTIENEKIVRHPCDLQAFKSRPQHLKVVL